jgi:hypothetical protein
MNELRPHPRSRSRTRAQSPDSSEALPQPTKHEYRRRYEATKHTAAKQTLTRGVSLARAARGSALPRIGSLQPLRSLNSTSLPSSGESPAAGHSPRP